MMTPRWSKEDIDLLKRLWLLGRSASEISAELGHKSRSAVLGMARRQHLPMRMTGQSRKTKPAPASIASLGFKPKAEKPALPVVATALPGTTFADLPQPVDAKWLPLLRLEHGMCRWPRDFPDGIRFCGCANQSTGTLYCEHHAALAVQRARLVDKAA